jgi:hypothetical protein
MYFFVQLLRQRSGVPESSYMGNPTPHIIRYGDEVENQIEDCKYLRESEHKIEMFLYFVHEFH